MILASEVGVTPSRFREIASGKLAIFNWTEVVRFYAKKCCVPQHDKSGASKGALVYLDDVHDGGGVGPFAIHASQLQSV